MKTTDKQRIKYHKRQSLLNHLYKRPPELWGNEHQKWVQDHRKPVNMRQKPSELTLSP